MTKNIKRTNDELSVIDKVLLFGGIALGLLSIILLNKYARSKIAPQFSISHPSSQAIFPLPTPTPVPYAKVEFFPLTVNDTNFQPQNISVTKNDLVKIMLKTDEGYHNFILNDYSINSKILATGKIVTISFVATKSGTFTFYSQTGRYTQSEPSGVLVVK